jgi:hypothetical protein
MHTRASIRAAHKAAVAAHRANKSDPELLAVADALTEAVRSLEADEMARKAKPSGPSWPDDEWEEEDPLPNDPSAQTQREEAGDE